ncbi:MAG: T9SS type A sorting domain-containing protein, partial [Flavobacteriaceae bacterium]|nr:T9SS type A sorting domain-containing protein [Flavobacteriaceae bacterium]
LIANGYNYDGTTTGNKIGKSIASNTGWTNWLETSMQNVVGSNQSTNNSSGFNLFPVGTRTEDGHFGGEWDYTLLWSSDLYRRNLDRNRADLERLQAWYTEGLSVRFVRNAFTASTNNYSNAITIYPNPTTSIITIQGDKEYDIEVYDMAGNKVMALTGNNINMAHLSTATYIVKATDKSNNEELTYKVVKN